MKLATNILFTVLFSCVTTATATNHVTWETLGNRLDQNNKAEYVQRFTIIPDGPFESMAFCIAPFDMRMATEGDQLIEILPGYYMVSSPRFLRAAQGDTLYTDVINKLAYRSRLYVPDGVHLVRDGKPVPAQFTLLSQIAFPEQWIDPQDGVDPMIYGDDAFAINDSIRSAYKATPYRQIPTPKKIEVTDQLVAANDLLNAEFEIITVDSPLQDYRLVTMQPYKITVKTNNQFPQVIKSDILRRIKESADENGMVPLATIEDWADFGYRGFMFDTARNFLPVNVVKRVVDLMSRYGLNTLHFHIGEDEGWRLEIPSLPELTRVGGRRGYTLTDDVPFLKGQYSGDGNPDSPTVANGFYSVQEYIDLLKYAHNKGVRIIPEFDTPGHSRAAIRAMEWRYKNTGDSSVRLIHDGDSSKYTSAQGFHDNTMNPAIEGPYNFMNIVFDEVIDIYRQAGVPLEAINIGGDEVGRGAWNGSMEAQKLMQQNGYTTQKDLHAHFVKKIAEIAHGKGIKLAGWEDIADGYDAHYDSVVRPHIYMVNSWNYSGDRGSKIAANGYPVVMSNVDYLYFDHHHSSHPEEPGMLWGGIVDEFKPLSATIETLMPGDSTVHSNVVGISAQLFGETLRDSTTAERYMLPRLLALAERAHNSHGTLTNREYFGLITEEMPRWNAEGYTFYLRQPGIVINDGVVTMNEPYGFGEIRYTIDGTEPTQQSALYTGPFSVPQDTRVRARLFVGPSWSVTSISR